MVEHDQRTMLAQRVLGIACGWEDLNDHHGLRADPLMQAASERGIDEARPLASPSTLCRLENRADRGACVELSKLLVELFVESFDSPPDELVLDFDATDDPVHGDQEGRFFHGYYDGYCYLPLYVFSGRSAGSYAPPNIARPSQPGLLKCWGRGAAALRREDRSRRLGFCRGS